MKHKIFTIAAGILLQCLLSAGENMFYNSSFEMGMNSWNDGMISYPYPYDPKTKCPHQWIETKDAPHGKHVMQITFDKNIKNFNPLGGSDVQLIPGKKYTISLYVKTEVDCTVNYSVHSNHNQVWHSASGFRSKWIKAGKWQRLHHTFVYEPKKKLLDDKYNICYLMFMAPKNGKSIQVDAIQLEEGELTDYKPAGAVEYTLTTQDLYLEKTEVEVEFSAFSYKKNVQVTKELWLADSGKNKIIQKKSATFKLVPGKIQRQKMTFAKLPYGGFKIFAKGENKAVAVDFVRIRRNNAVYQKGKFAIGIGTQALGLFQNRDMNLLVQPKRFTQDEGELVRRTGSVVAYSFDGASNALGFLVPEKRGKYDWTYHDLLYRRARELKLKMMASVGSSAILTSTRKKDLGKKVPQWLRDMDRTGHPEGTWQGGWEHTKVILPPPETIAEPAGAMCKRYEDDICMFRLFGEANGYIRAHQLVEYAKAVYTEIKKQSPKTVVNSINATEDGGSAMGGYFDQYMKAGGGKYTDVVTFHPYRSSQDNSAVSAMDGVQSFYKVMKLYNMKFPLAETECFYLIPNPYSGSSPEYTWSLFEPAALARRMLIDLGEGLFMSIPLEMGHLHRAMAAHDECVRGYFTNAPQAHFAVHNAMGYFLNNADQPERIKLPGNELCYKFRNHGKLYSAIWRISGKSDMLLDLPKNVTCKVYDIYGNIVKDAKGQLKIELNREPVILEWSKGADPVKLHKAANYAAHQMIEFYGVKTAGNGVMVLFCNRSGKVLSGKVRVESEYLNGGKIIFKNLMPHAMTSIAVPATVKAGAPEKFIVWIVVSADGKVESTQKELTPVPVLKIGPAGTSVRIQDHSFKLQKQGQALKITADLASTKMVVPANPGKIWEGDSVEIYLDMNPFEFNPADVSRYNDKCVQLLLAATKEGPLKVGSLRFGLPCPLPAGVSATTKLFPGKGARIEAVVPWHDGMGFNIRFNGSGKGVTWRGRDNYKARCHFAILTEMK